MLWKCICDCGNETLITTTDLLHRPVPSCGCYSKDCARNNRIKENIYDLTSNDYGIGFTSNNDKFYFDLEDYDLIKDYCWRLRKDGYLDAKLRDGSGKRILMHDLIMGQKYVDHIGGTETRNDNRKCNLRIPDDEYSFETYNNMNKRIQSNNTTGYVGISWHKRDRVWEANITINKKQLYLGRYDNIDDAICARKEAERKYFGKWSNENSKNIFENNKGR